MLTEQKKITKEMTIDEIFATFPHQGGQLAEQLMDAGLQCAGCSAATWETLETGVSKHGFSQSDLDHLIDKLNAIIEGKTTQIEETTPQVVHPVTLTKRAADKFLELVARKGKTGWGLRFGDRGGGCSGFEYVFDYAQKPEPNDLVFHSEGVDIYVNKKSAERLMGSVIDYIDTLYGSEFKVTNPNTIGACGCGKSQNY